MCWEGRRSFACDPSAARRGREFCRQHLNAVLDPTQAGDYLDDVTLVVSELMTNAVNAGCSDTQLLINLHRDHVRVAVSDDGAGWPQMQRPTSDQGHGRGLQIVDQLAIGWGVEVTPAGKQVWADIVIAADLTDGIDCELERP